MRCRSRKEQDKINMKIMLQGAKEYWSNLPLRARKRAIEMAKTLPMIKVVDDDPAKPIIKVRKLY